MFSVLQAANANLPGFLLGELIPFREFTRLTGKTPAETVAALEAEMPGRYALHRHDFPAQIVADGRQDDFYWLAKDSAELGSYDTPFIGFAYRR